MIDLLAMLGKMGMPSGFDISSIVGGKAPAPGGAPGGASPMPQMPGAAPQQSGAIPQAPPPAAAPQMARPQTDMSALLQAISNRPKLGV